MAAFFQWVRQTSEHHLMLDAQDRVGRKLGAQLPARPRGTEIFWRRVYVPVFHRLPQSVRDAMIWAAVPHTQAAAELWTHIARRLRAQPRAEALTIAAVAYCLLSDTIRAGIAIECNEEAAVRCQVHRLAIQRQCGGA